MYGGCLFCPRLRAVPLQSVKSKPGRTGESGFARFARFSRSRFPRSRVTILRDCSQSISVPFILSCLSNLRNAIDRETIKLRTTGTIEAFARTHGGVYMYGLVVHNVLQIDRSTTLKSFETIYPNNCKSAHIQTKNFVWNVHTLIIDFSFSTMTTRVQGKYSYLFDQVTSF